MNIPRSRIRTPARFGLEAENQVGRATRYGVAGGFAGRLVLARASRRQERSRSASSLVAAAGVAHASQFAVEADGVVVGHAGDVVGDADELFVARAGVGDHHRA